VSTDTDEETMTVAYQIARYLEEHPNAADTLDGVAQWWLLRQRYQESRKTVETALAWLVEQGLVTKSTTAGGQEIYSRTPRPHDEQSRQ